MSASECDSVLFLKVDYSQPPVGHTCRTRHFETAIGGKDVVGAMKLAARLRSYDWTAAAIELLIVVAGILIALQVSNWNESRLDHARADSYYRRLHTELLADHQNIDRVLVFWNKVSAYGQAAIANGESGQRVGSSN